MRFYKWIENLDGERHKEYVSDCETKYNILEFSPKEEDAVDIHRETEQKLLITCCDCLPEIVESVEELHILALRTIKAKELVKKT